MIRSAQVLRGCRILLSALVTSLLTDASPGQDVAADAIPAIPETGSAQKAISAPAPPDSLHQFERLNGGAITRVFAKAIEPGLDSVARIETANGRLVALAAAITSNGYLLSKASEVQNLDADKIFARIAESDLMPARIVQMQKENDLALLKVEAELVPVNWGASSGLKTGFWVSAIANAHGAVRVGIVSAPLRAIQREGGVMGVALEKRPGGGALVARVFEESGASAAGIKSGDAILFVAGTAIESREQVTEIVSTFDADETVEVVVERTIDGKLKKRAIDVTLGYRRVVLEKVDRNERLSGAASNRRAGFENVIQHDIPLGPEAMGGPLFTIDGKAVGLNIARRDRVTTYALPSEVAQRVARDMITIDLGPAAEGSEPNPTASPEKENADK